MVVVGLDPKGGFLLKLNTADQYGGLYGWFLLCEGCQKRTVPMEL